MVHGAGDTQNETDPLVVSKEPHPMQRVKPCGLSSISQLVDQKFIHPLKETKNLSLNQEREGGKGSARSINPIPAPTHYLLPERTQLLPSHPTSPAIWPSH